MTKSIYKVTEDRIIILDEEIGLNFESPFFSETAERTRYPSGSLKSEIFYHKDYLKKLHGPSSFYYLSGTLSSQNWFIEGKQEGRGTLFFPTGLIASISRYKGGTLNGIQESFYPDGTPKTVMHYEQGKLNGSVTLYHDNGKLKKEIIYLEGQREGIAKEWNRNGILISEQLFQENTPTKNQFWDHKGVPKH